ncbi:26S proteasome complex subunit [Emydomyces testavorans]|uniref:26S proteasome complex subunit SEM1 n=1 Tax=Emydomyces testavorans TaxID=2070801 RepID=A0AAF0DM26_9EURO|nr:26S proteasome complex subunit [Emydomyces testavorans]
MSNNPSTGATNPQAQDKPSAQHQKPTVALEENDEFEDFPVEGKWRAFDWPQEDAEVLGPAGTNNDHLWEESWDDDDNNEEFSKQLKEELKKVEAVKQ